MMSSLKLLYRAGVMLASLALGGLAFHVYQPELQQLGPMVHEMTARVVKRWQGKISEPPPASEPEPFTGNTLEAIAAAPPRMPYEGEKNDQTNIPSENIHQQDEAPRFDPAVQPALAEVPVFEGRSSSDRPTARDSTVSETVAQVVEQLQLLGVNGYSLQPWGEHQAYYRFACSLPWGYAGMYTRQFEAIAAEPVAAAKQVLTKVIGWQGEINSSLRGEKR